MADIRDTINAIPDAKLDEFLTELDELTNKYDIHGWEDILLLLARGIRLRGCHPDDPAIVRECIESAALHLEYAALDYYVSTK